MKFFSVLLASFCVTILCGSFNIKESVQACSRQKHFDLCDIVGYTCLTCTNVVGEFEGADYEKIIKLENGMIFEFNEYNNAYAYQPEVAVFYNQFMYGGRELTTYKLWIEEEMYDVTRIK